MFKISVVIILLLQAWTSVAQNYFVFIGSDNRQPFYVRVDSEFHGSSPEGHLILSRLKDSTYNITLGFPGQTQAEQHYSFNIDGKDQAFELRSQDPANSGMGLGSGSVLRLYDLQNNQWLSPQGGGVAPGDARSAGIKKDDAFSRMMAGVVHDTAVLYNTYAMEQALSDSPTVAATRTAPVPTQSATPSAQSAPVPTQSATASAQSAPATIHSAPATAPAAPQSGPPDTTSATAAITTPSPTHASPDSAANKPGDTTIAATGNPPIAMKTSATSTTTTPASRPQTTPADTAIATTGNLATSPVSALPANAAPANTIRTAATLANTTPAGAITHQPAARFNDSGATASSLRPIPGDPTATATPNPGGTRAPFHQKASGITKLSEHHTTKNVRLVYADRSGDNKADTVVVIIPVDSPAMAKNAARPPHTADSSHVPAARAHGPNADSPVVSSGAAYRPTVPPPAPAEATRPHPADSSHKPGKRIIFVNSDCHDFATDFDVDRLRVRMLEFPKEEERIAVARKAFKVKCFYTRQIRALSDVFTSDATKFRFFEAAWPFAADEHFHELSNLLTDPVYNNRFKTMTHQQ